MVVAALLVALPVIAGCSDGNRRKSADRSDGPTSRSGIDAAGSDTPSSTYAPTDPAFYQPPDPLPDGAPGELIRSTPLPAPEGVRAWKILYHSRTVDGRDIAVSGVVVAPAGAPPSDGRPIVAVAPATSGLADKCSQSKTPDALLSSRSLQQHIEAGRVAVVTDYEGLGTPGLHPYGVGESAGRSLLDAARSVTHIRDAGAGTRIVLSGHSQGGHAAFYAGGLAPTYAPDLDIRGVVTVAPPIDLVTLLRNASAAPDKLGPVVMFVRGFAAAYPELDVHAVLTESAVTMSSIVERECSDDVVGAFRERSAADVLVMAPSDVPAWQTVLERNSLHAGRVVAPVLLVKGDADRLLPKPFTDLFVERLCAGGDLVEYRVYPGAGHADVLDASEAESNAWITDRFDGLPASSTCPQHP